MGSGATLRVALAPVYLDSELGVPRAMSPDTDVAFGLAGGGFADSFTELRRGEYVRGQSFTGHGARLSASIYHLFNPGRKVPLNGVLRTGAHLAEYEKAGRTDAAFALPPPERSVFARAGLRMGGEPPVLAAEKAAEASLWYEASSQANPGSYGYAGDRRREPLSHRFWARELFAYPVPRGDLTRLSLIEGGSSHPDRFSAWRLGGALPFTSEFPLRIPGYAYGQLSATRFVLLNASHTVGLGEPRRWSVAARLGLAWLDYLPGFEEPGRWHLGLGTDLRYKSPGRAWQFQLGVAEAPTALRPGGRGAQSVFFVLQYDLLRSAGPLQDMRDNPYLRSLGERLFGD